MRSPSLFILSRLRRSGFILIALLVLSDLSANPDPVEIAVTFPILKSWTEYIGGEHVRVHSLVNENSSVHTYEPIPGDLKMLHHAELIIANGQGLEFWLNALLDAANTRAPRLILSENMPGMHWEEAHTHHHESAVVDPHMWMNPDTACRMVMATADAMSRIRPELAGAFQSNAHDWVQHTREADRQSRKILADIPEAGKRFITYHNNLGYWADHYGFTLLGSALHSLSSHHEDPSAEHLAQLVHMIRKERVTALVFTDRENPKLLQQLSRETGVPLVGPLCVETLPPPMSDFGQNRYAALLMSNARLLARELAPAGKE